LGCSRPMTEGQHALEDPGSCMSAVKRPAETVGHGEAVLARDVDDARDGEVAALRRMAGRRVRGYEGLGYPVERPDVRSET